VSGIAGTASGSVVKLESGLLLLTIKGGREVAGGLTALIKFCLGAEFVVVAVAVVVVVIGGLAMGLTMGTSRRDISLRGEEVVLPESAAGVVAVAAEDLEVPFDEGLLFDVLFSRSDLVLTSLRVGCALLGLSVASLDIFVKLLAALLDFKPSLMVVVVVVAVVEGKDVSLSGLGLRIFIEDGLVVAPVDVMVVGLFEIWLSFGFLITSPEL